MCVCVCGLYFHLAFLPEILFRSMKNDKEGSITSRRTNLSIFPVVSAVGMGDIYAERFSVIFDFVRFVVVQLKITVMMITEY